MSLTPDASGSESETEMSKNVTLAMIPTLRYLYKNKTLVSPAVELQKFKYKSEWLDKVSLYQGDITRLEVGAIVNAAKASLLGGGGVDGQIHRAAGPNLVKECRTLGGANTGEAKITKGYKLPSKHVIHAVGPIYDPDEKDLKATQLASCYTNGLDVAVENQVGSIVFCSISTGIYGYPIVDATRVALTSVRKYLDEGKADKLDRIVFCVWSNKDRDVYQELVPQYFPAEEEVANKESEGTAVQPETPSAAETS